MQITSIVALAANDVWFGGLLIGEFDLGGAPWRPLAMHWDGSSMSLFPTPVPSGTGGPYVGIIQGMAAVIPTEIYACGARYAVGRPTGPTATVDNLVLRFDGTTWSQLTIPTSPVLHLPRAIVATGSNDIWVFMNIDPRVAPHALRFDGTAWRNVAAPYAECAAARSANEIYTATFDVQRWDGATWSTAASFPGASFPSLLGIAASGACDVWAVGAETAQTAAGWIGLPFAPHLQPAAGAAIEPRKGCLARAPARSLVALGLPILGQPLTLAADDRDNGSQLTPGRTAGVFALSSPLGSNGTCGAVLAGLGPARGPGEFLLAPTSLALVAAPTLWGGPTQPVTLTLALPNQSALVGQVLSAQAVLFDPTTPAGLLTSALDLRLGR